jgi:hypothetical protein
VWEQQGFKQLNFTLGFLVTTWRDVWYQVHGGNKKGANTGMVTTRLQGCFSESGGLWRQ